MIRKILYTIASCIIISGCSKAIPDGAICCEEVEYVTSFPHTLTLEKEKPLDADFFGCWNFYSADSLALANISYRAGSDYYFNIYSIPDKFRMVSTLWHKGNGHDELTSSPTSVLPVVTDSIVYCDFWDYQSNTWYRCNLTESISSGKTVVEKRETLTDRSNFIDECYNINDSTFFQVRFADGISGRERGILKNGKFETFDYLGNLNSVRIENDMNAIGSVKCFNRNSGMVAEAMLMLNQINIYSTQKRFSKTICLGKSLEAIDNVDINEEESSNRYVQFGFSRGFDKFFATLHFGMKSEEYSNKSKNPSLMFFDWEGNPILEIKLPIFATSFFIYNDNLYLFSTAGEKEEVFSYPLPEFIK